MNAIPTTYKSVRFRSRLEAKWACFFDLIGWNWLYEPFDLGGYIPDFIIQFKEKKLLVEVKPLTGCDTKLLEATQKKIEVSGWFKDGDEWRKDSDDWHNGLSDTVLKHDLSTFNAALIVGCGINLDPKHEETTHCIGEKGGSPLYSIGWIQDFSWSFGGYEPCYITLCTDCRKNFYWNQQILWNCQHCLEDRDKPYRYHHSRHPDVKELFAQASNTVQWRGR